MRKSNNLLEISNKPSTKTKLGNIEPKFGTMGHGSNYAALKAH